jgi:hypothetical protein
MYSPAAVGHINPRAANAMALTLWGSFVAKNGWFIWAQAVPLKSS